MHVAVVGGSSKTPHGSFTECKNKSSEFHRQYLITRFSHTKFADVCVIVALTYVTSGIDIIGIRFIIELIKRRCCQKFRLLHMLVQ